MTFKEQLQEARKAAGLSQEQLAKLMNMSRQGVSHWENDRALPDAETLKKLSQVLNYNFEEIESAGEENPVETPAEETPEAKPEAETPAEPEAPESPAEPEKSDETEDTPDA